MIHLAKKGISTMPAKKTGGKRAASSTTSTRSTRTPPPGKHVCAYCSAAPAVAVSGENLPMCQARLDTGACGER